jgi:hypothetical protein
VNAGLVPAALRISDTGVVRRPCSEGTFVAKAKPSDEAKLLEGLQKAAAAGNALPATSTAKTPGIFPAGKVGKDLVRRAVELGYLEECEGPAPTAPKKSGSKAKATAPHARITPRGLQWVQSQLDPRPALEPAGRRAPRA